MTLLKNDSTSRVFPRSVAAGLLVASLLVSQTRPAQSDEPAPKASASDDAFSKRLQEYFQKSAGEYELFRDELKKEPLTFVPQAVFHWKHDNEWRGDVFVWTYEGRPEVVGGVFVSPPSGNSRTVNHEFYSLALQPIGAIKTPRGTWQAKSGVRLTPVPDAKAPATSEPLRGAQLREMARQFTVTMKDDEGQPWELRLLPQPLYRYSSPSQKVLDGALFAYVWTKGTDPDCVLLVEARDDGNGAKWVYTPVRMTFRALEMKHGGQSVWISERNAPDPMRPEPYTWFPVGRLPIAEEPK